MRKMQKHNMNKIYQIEPRLKEMTCFMTIVENAILAPSNPSLNITGITLRKIWSNLYEPVTWKGPNYGNLLHRYMFYEKTIVPGRKQPNCKNVKTDNLQLENTWKIPMREFLRKCRTTLSRLKYAKFQEKNKNHSMLRSYHQEEFCKIVGLNILAKLFLCITCKKLQMLVKTKFSEHLCIKIPLEDCFWCSIFLVRLYVYFIYCRSKLSSIYIKNT